MARTPAPTSPATEEQRLLADLATLRDVERPALLAGMSTVTGDAADQAERTQREMDLAQLDMRIHRLESRLDRLRTGRPRRRNDGDVVTVGSTVTVDFGDGPEQYTLTDLDDPVATAAVITPTSPLGRALLGAQPGQTVHVRTPASLSDVRLLTVS